MEEHTSTYSIFSKSLTSQWRLFRQDVTCLNIERRSKRTQKYELKWKKYNSLQSRSNFYLGASRWDAMQPSDFHSGFGRIRETGSKFRWRHHGCWFDIRIAVLPATCQARCWRQHSQRVSSEPYDYYLKFNDVIFCHDFICLGQSTWVVTVICVWAWQPCELSTNGANSTRIEQQSEVLW